MPDDEIVRELERLRAENAALNEQVMLLVQTEQRLYRSQNELDSQLVRIRALARFALESSGSEPPAEIVGRAVELLSRGFALDWVGVVALGDGAPDVDLICAQDAPRVGERRLPADPGVHAWLAALTQPVIVRPEAVPAGAPPERFARALLGGLEQPWGGAGCELACAPFRRADGRRAGVMVAYASHRRAAAHGGRLGEERLPFLDVLALHTEHAIATSRLTESLRERSEQLAASLEALENTQAALLQSQKMEAIGRLAGGVAHDFNNLLTVILGYASTLTLSLPPETPTHENARRIVDAARRASGITGQLLALGRRQVQTPERLDLAEQAQRLVDLLRRLVGEHIGIELEFDRELPHVRADRSQLEQILLNLVVNARDAMPRGGRMRIVTRRASPADAARCDGPLDPGAFGVLEVHDDGVGMDELTRSRIFEPFFTTKPAGQGTGLGLAVVYGIVRQSGGQVLVTSTPGAGSVFTVLLPCAPEGPASDEGPRAEDAPAADDALPAARIMVAEDEPGIRGVIAAALMRAGFEVEVVADGEEALAGMRAAPPALLLTDVSMPRMGGFQLARVVREELPNVRVAFMSGYFGDRAGVAIPGPFLTKPFAPDELVRFVRAQLRPAAGADGAP
jgi:signal transduction histidine kinase